MATYKGIQGYSVQTLASDPGTLSEVEGQLWYNSTSGTYKISVGAAGAWAAGGAVNVGRRSFASCGTQTAALIACGVSTPSTPAPIGEIDTETYNGSSWTEAPNTNTANQYVPGAGTTTAALKIAGSTPADGAGTTAVEEYNGTSWTTSPASLASNRKMMGSAQQGTTTASLIFGGTAVAPSTPVLDLTEIFDGTTWTETADLNTARRSGPGAGTSTAALFISGNSGPTNVANVEDYNGTSWSETGDVNTARQSAGGAGSTTAALIFGGAGAPSGQTEQFNGTSWTEVADLATAREGVGGAGTSPAGLAISGYVSNNVTNTEEWSGAPVTAKTVTVS
jgi:hypothetical protein